MSDHYANGAASNGDTPRFSLAPPKFDVGAVAEFWQSSAARLMRSSQVVMRGMAEVARLEAELGRQLLRRGMTKLKPPVLGEAAQDRACAQLNHASQEFENLFASLSKIGDEARSAWRDATLVLFDATSPAVHPSPPAAQHIDVPLVKPKSAANGATTARAAAAE